MNHINYLEPVIRPATEYTVPATPAETIVVIDALRRQAVDRVRLIDSFTRDLKYVVVSSTADGQKVAKAAIRLPYTNGLAKDQKISIVLRYEAGCKHGNERLVARSLFNGPNPGVVFNDLLAKWVTEYLNVRLSQFTEDYQSEKSNLEGVITGKALNEVGLNLDVEISVEGHDKLETVVYGPAICRVRFKDSDEEEDLQVKIAMGVDEQRIVKAILNQTTSLSDLVTKTAQTYFAENISLETFCFELSSNTVKLGLRICLNEALKSVGRKINSISLDAETDVPRPFRKDLEITYGHLGYPEPILIKTSVLMIPHDIVRYRGKKSPELDSWVEVTLRGVIDEVLFGAEYLDLLIRFGPLEEKIKAEMNRKAEAIGITVKQLITKPYLEHVDGLKRIDIEIDKEKNEGLFDTSIPACNIRLGIAVTARIKDLERVSDRLKGKQNIPEEMERRIHTITKQYVRAIDPERFYMRYSDTDQELYPQEIPVERELSDKIVTLLANEFYAEVTHLTLTRGKTEITEDLAKLLKESHDFKATVSLGDFKGSGAFVVTGAFGVQGVHYNGWKRFQERDSSIEKIKKRIEDSIHAELRPRSTGLILFRDQENLYKLKDKLLSVAKELILDEFGLVITLTTVVCSFTGIEEDGRKAARILEKIGKLEELRIDMLASGVTKEEIKSVEGQIEVLRSLLLPETSLGLARIELRAEPESPTPTIASDRTNRIPIPETGQDT